MSIVLCMYLQKGVDNSIFTDMPSPKIPSEQRQEVYKAFSDWIAQTDFPIMAAFVSENPVAMRYMVTKYNMFDWREMRPLVDLAIAKTEAYLVRKGMNGQASGMSIFVLKQAWHGYTDKTEQNITSDGEKVKFFNTLPRGTKTTAKDKVKGKR